MRCFIFCKAMCEWKGLYVVVHCRAIDGRKSGITHTVFARTADAGAFKDQLARTREFDRRRRRSDDNGGAFGNVQ